MQDDAADQLHVEVAHAGRAHAGFAHDRKGFGQNFIQDLAARVDLRSSLSRVSLTASGNLLFEIRGLLAQLLVGKLLNLGLEFVDLVDSGLNGFQKALVTAAENFG